MTTKTDNILITLETSENYGKISIILTTTDSVPESFPSVLPRDAQNPAKKAS